jgi:6-phosphofructokinase 2
MIYTLTLDPTLDKTIDVDEFVYDDVNMIVEQNRSAGGKGINVSRAIRELGGQSVALGFMGGFNGLEAEGRLTNEGIICDFTRINKETGERVVIHQRKKKTQTLLSTCPPEVEPFEIITLLNKVRQLPKGSTLIISGTIPPGVSDSLYAQMITLLKDSDVKVFLDADGEAMKKGVHAGPYLIKPNIHEFGRLTEKNFKDYDDIFEAIDPYMNLAETAIVSMGAKGAIGASRQERFVVTPPKVAVKSSTGAGDALLAGVAYGLNKAMSFKDALTLGVACGTASTLMADSGVLSVNDVNEIRSNLVIKSS